MQKGPIPIRAGALEGVTHGFFGREGGVSTGAVAGLQIGQGAGDDPAAVEENRARVIAALSPGAGLVLPYQVHSADAAIVTAPMADDEADFEEEEAYAAPAAGGCSGKRSPA